MTQKRDKGAEEIKAMRPLERRRRRRPYAQKTFCGRDFQDSETAARGPGRTAPHIPLSRPSCGRGQGDHGTLLGHKCSMPPAPERRGGPAGLYGISFQQAMANSLAKLGKHPFVSGTSYTWVTLERSLYSSSGIDGRAQGKGNATGGQRVKCSCGVANGNPSPSHHVSAETIMRRQHCGDSDALAAGKPRGDMRE